MIASDHIGPRPLDSPAPAKSEAKAQIHENIPDTSDQDLEKGQTPGPIVEPHAPSQASQDTDSDSGAQREATTIRELAKSTLAALGFKKRVVILRVMDLSFDGSAAPFIQLECAEPKHLGDSLKSLPKQNRRAARIFLCSSYVEEEKLPQRAVLSYLKELGVRNVDRSSRLHAPSFTQLAPQWLEKCDAKTLGIRIPDEKDEVFAYMQCIRYDKDNLAGMFLV